MRNPFKFSDIRFDQKELLELLLYSLFTAFFLSFNDWGIEHFDALYGLKNLLRAFFVVIIISLLSVSIAKYVAIRLGSELKIRFNYIASLFFFIFNFIFYAIVPIAGALNFIFDFDTKKSYGHSRVIFQWEYMKKVVSVFVYVQLILLLVLHVVFKEIYAFKYLVASLFLLLPIPKMPGFYFAILGKESIKNAIFSYIILLIFIALIFFIL